jgi:hypothetical protein
MLFTDDPSFTNQISRIPRLFPKSRKTEPSFRKNTSIFRDFLSKFRNMEIFSYFFQFSAMKK